MFHLPPGEKPQRPKPRQPKAYRNPIILAREWQQALDSGEHGSQADLARKRGISRARVTQVLHLLKLAPDVLNAIAALGDPLPSHIVTERMLRRLVHRSAYEQRQTIGKILANGAQMAKTSI
jgi:hypothetical protein